MFSDNGEHRADKGYSRDLNILNPNNGKEDKEFADEVNTFRQKNFESRRWVKSTYLSLRER